MVFFKNRQFEFQALRVISTTPADQADICEVISTCKKIKDGDCANWCSEWTKIAHRIRKFGEESLASSYTASASQSFLRASNYYRTAEFYLNYGCDNDLMLKIDTLCTQCFNLAIQYGPYDIEPVEIPFEGTHLPGHFYHTSSNLPAPTVIVITGNDGNKEELYAIGISAIKRGMNCLTFDGPGQGETIRRRRIPFRYNYETAVTPAVNFAIQDSLVDPEKIVLWGESLGGYFAPRAVAFEQRISACVANGGIYDCIGYKKFSGMTSDKRSAMLHRIRNHTKGFNLIVNLLMKLSVNLDWTIRHGMTTFMVTTPAEYILSYEPYWLEGIVSKITCPTLVTDNEKEVNFPKQAKILYDALECPKEYLYFTQEEGAGYHCELGCRLYANDRIFNWIQKR